MGKWLLTGMTDTTCGCLGMTIIDEILTWKGVCDVAGVCD